MVYTGKLPLGKHNVSRMVAAAESLQMFDLAVGFKNVLTTLVNHRAPDSSPQITSDARSNEPEVSASLNQEDLPSDRMEKKHQLDGEDGPVEPESKRSCEELSHSSGLFLQLIQSKEQCLKDVFIPLKLFYSVKGLKLSHIRWGVTV